MSIPATLLFANPDPGAAPTTLQQLVTLLNQLGAVTIAGDYLPYVLSPTTPAVDDQDKLWAKTDGAGRPVGVFLFYNGTWRRFYNGVPGDVKFYSGNPTVDFDGTGLGIVGGNYDGWALANGANGTINLSDRFLIGGRMDNVGITGYSGSAWRTNVDGTPETEGGVASITLSADNTYAPATPAYGGHDIWTANGNTRSSGGDLWGVPMAGTAGTDNIIEANAGNPTPPAIPTVPPFYALAIVAWVGYA